MSNDLKTVTEALDTLKKGFEEFKKVNDTRLAEIETKGAADPLTVEKLEKIEKSMQASEKVVEEFKNIEKALKNSDKALEDFKLETKRAARIKLGDDGKTIDLDAKALEWAKYVGRQTGAEDEAKSFNAESMVAYERAFERLLRRGFNPATLPETERKALSVGSDSDGGYWVTPDESGRIVKQVYETSPMRAYASVQVISTDSLEGAYDNDEAGAGWVTELGARTDSATPVIGRWAIPVHELYAMPSVSQKLLDDSMVPVESWLSDKIGQRFSRIENAAFITGTGTGQPRGVMTYPDGTDLTNSIERHDTGVNGDFAAAPDAFDILITALYDLRAQYRALATWFMNTSTLGALRLEKDSDGRYFWQPAATAGQPSTILGFPLAVFEDMADLATDSLSIAVGDMRAAYQIVDRIGIRMLRDPYSSKPNVLFYATKRTGGDLINGEALKIIEFTA